MPCTRLHQLRAAIQALNAGLWLRIEVGRGGLLAWGGAVRCAVLWRAVLWC